MTVTYVIIKMAALDLRKVYIVTVTITVKFGYYFLFLAIFSCSSREMVNLNLIHHKNNQKVHKKIIYLVVEREIKVCQKIISIFLRQHWLNDECLGVAHISDLYYLTLN